MDSSTLTTALREHWALFTSVLSASFVALRIFSVAQYDPATGYGILQAGGTGDVLIGAALSSIGIIVPFIAEGAFILRHFLKGDNKGRVARNILLAVVTISVIVSVAATYLITEIVVSSSLVLFMVVYRLDPWESNGADDQLPKVMILNSLDQRESNGADAKLPKAGSRTLAGLRGRFWGGILTFNIVVALLTTTLNTTPWLPAEKISISGKPIVAYVLADSGTYTAILSAAPRRIEYVSSNRITGRNVCNYGQVSWETETILQLLTQEPRYPSCKN